MRNKNIILAAALAVASAGPGAQTVWRCGNSYGTQPCAGGSMVETAPAPSPEEAAKAAGAARIDAQRAGALEKARLEQEKKAPKAIVMGPAQAPQAPKAGKNAAAKKKEKGGQARDFTAVVPGTGKAAKKN